MTSTLSMKMFPGAPISLFPIIPLPNISAIPKLFVLLTILVLGVVFWYSFAWMGTQMTFQVASYNAIFIEGIDPVLPEYYSGFGR